MRPIAEYKGVDRQRFRDEIRPLAQPAVLRGLAADWPVVRAGSVEAFADYLTGLASPRPVAVLVGPPEIEGRFFYKPGLTELNFVRGSSPLAPFLDRLLADRGNPRPHAAAIQSEPVAELLPGFRKANDIDLVAPEVIPRAWIGNKVRVAPHYDLKENIGVVAAGRRLFTLFPPEQIANLYPGPFELTPAGTPVSLVDPAAPDLEQYPRFADALEAAQKATLEPGDAIYIPYHWWHAVDSLEPVNMLVNYWWSEAQPGMGSPYDALLHALYALRHLPEEQRAVWRTIFDHYVFCTDGDPAAHLPEAARGVLGDPTPEELERMRSMLKQLLGRL
jgi:hypothetical protein